MATEKQKRLAEIIKECHDSLRLMSRIHGPERAWEEHLKNTRVLEEYSKSMNELAKIWETNTENVELLARSRIKWTIEYCMKYFFTERIILQKREREMRLLESWDDCGTSDCVFLDPADTIQLLDVGSCFNPFREAKHIQVTAIDLHPANDTVYRGDFLKIAVCDMLEPHIKVENVDKSVHELPSRYFECIVFSLLLEYIPSSDQRFICCQKAYDLLKHEGILIIVTPDSQHVGKNAMLMKNWRYTLATLGFSRIKFEKLPHITCMTFRKASDKRLAHRWAALHHESYMTLSIDIPQDNK